MTPTRSAITTIDSDGHNGAAPAGTNTNLQANADSVDGTDESIRSILKPSSLSLEPRDLRARANINADASSKKVQFEVPSGEYGGRGKTEFKKCPSRKSHTKRAIPAGTFDTDSDSQPTGSDVDSENANSSLPGYSLLDTVNSQKFCQNSRLIKLVRRKKKRKEKEQQWLSMISPEIGLHPHQKTVSRIDRKLNEPAQQSKAIPISTSMNIKLHQHVKPAAVSSLAVNYNTERFKSPSAALSRGRRALYKAQKAIHSKPVKTGDVHSKQVQSTPIIKGTPMVQKVTKIAARMQEQTASLRGIQEDDTGHDGDHEDNYNEDERDITMADAQCDDEQKEPSKQQQQQQQHRSCSEIVGAEKQESGDANHDEMEVKDNSHENSPKVDDADLANRNAEDDDTEILSDEMKTDESCSSSIKLNKGAEDKQLASLSIAYEEDEDDDLVLEAMESETRSELKRSSGIGGGGGTGSTRISSLFSLFMPKSMSDVLEDDANTNNDKMNYTEAPITSIATNTDTVAKAVVQSDEVKQIEDDKHKEQQQLNFTALSPPKSKPDKIVAAAQEDEQTEAPSNEDAALLVVSRSIGTQTECIPCEIGIQTDADADNMNSVDISTPFVVMKNKPTVIVTSTGSKYVRMDSENDAVVVAQEEHNADIIKKEETMDADGELEIDNNAANIVDVVVSRSIGTQTECIPCEIGIQTDADADNMNSVDISTPFVVMKNKPTVIVTSTGSKYVRMDSENDAVVVSQEEHNADIIKKEKTMDADGELEIDNNAANIVDVEVINIPPQNHRSELSPILEDENADQLNANDNDENQHGNQRDVAQNRAVSTEQQLQSLSLNIEPMAAGDNASVPRRDRSKLKRKYNEAMLGTVRNDENRDPNAHVSAENDAARSEHSPLSAGVHAKRRRVNDAKLMQLARENEELRVKFRNSDLVWVSAEDRESPTMILECLYLESERFYPSHYELVWLEYIDETGKRAGKCSITTVSYKEIKRQIEEHEMDQLARNAGICTMGWLEIKQYKPQLYRQYFDSRDRRKSTKANKKKRRRRASVM
eukprot:CAMPEP_0197073452 /NCGR_PEP_ID=MMETSP1384-20130603/210610_1 /TAXON_ID=29189 /ORGANISM="Ammonia sp." /LENGTH=1048 /DNA_ID=CAMNT_0042512289 /DNA_START=106 /DNA_END=3252 /DNA_ORIENTATION=-